MIMITVWMYHQDRRANTWWAQWLTVQQRKLVSAMETNLSGSMESQRQRWHSPLSRKLYEKEKNGWFPQSDVTYVIWYTGHMYDFTVCLVLSCGRGTHSQCWSLTVSASPAILGERCPSFLWWQTPAPSHTIPNPCTLWKEAMDLASCWGKRGCQRNER